MTSSAAHSFTEITIHATPHPDPHVRRAGFPVGHPYVERVTVAALGPSGVMFLRRAAQLWESDLSPTMDPADIAASLGLARSVGRGSRFWRCIDRIDRLRFGKAIGPGEILVYTDVAPLDGPDLGRASEWTRAQHYELLDAHLAQLAA